MKTSVWGLVAMVVVAWAAAEGWRGAGLAWGQRTAAEPPTLGAVQALTLPTAPGERPLLAVLDPQTRALGVYQVDAATGEIALKCVRNIQWDLRLTEFNGVSPLPSEIRSMVGGP